MSKSLLEAVAKVVLFAKSATALKIHKAEFDKGVYRFDLSGVSLPEKPFVQDIVGEHMLCKDLVEKILERDPRARDDDMFLILSVWDAQGVHIELNDVELETMFNSESIRRSRQKIQNTDGKFLPTSWAVAKRRGLNEELLREHYGKGDAM